MDLRERRDLITTEPNPEKHLDYVVDLKGCVTYPGDQGVSQIEVRYIPDRLILRSGTFDTYLKTLGTIKWSSVEELAATILNDLSNELVCRWVQVIVSAADDEHASVDRHSVLIEDQQPGWSNPRLIDHLKRR